jgi:hypothetical protein
MRMSVYVSITDGLAAFGDIFFFEGEADKMKKFAEDLGYTVEIQETDKRFSTDNSPFRKIMVRDIDWSDYNNVLYVINNRDKTDEQICSGLKSEGSGFSVTIKRGQIMTEYINLLEKIHSPITSELKVELAKIIALHFMGGVKGMENDIIGLRKHGCTVGKVSGFPECVDGFNKECFKCPNNINIIGTDADISKYNFVLKKQVQK